MNRKELQEVLFPLLLKNNLIFLNDRRRLQFHRAMYILNNNIKLFKDIPDTNNIPSLSVLPDNALDYTKLDFFNNWIVGFTIAEGSFLIKSNGDGCFQLHHREDKVLFEALKLVFDTNRKIGLTKDSININNKDVYNMFSVSSLSDIQKVINFFSFSGHHPLLGHQSLRYNKWLLDLRNSKRYANLNYESLENIN